MQKPESGVLFKKNQYWGLFFTFDYWYFVFRTKKLCQQKLYVDNDFLPRSNINILEKLVQKAYLENDKKNNNNCG